MYDEFMEYIEIKSREIDNSEFVVGYTKKIVEILNEPQMSLEVKAGQVSEDVTRLVESLGYDITDQKPMEGWVRLIAVKQNK
jgi:hypothetical protein